MYPYRGRDYHDRPVWVRETPDWAFSLPELRPIKLPRVTPARLRALPSLAAALCMTVSQGALAGVAVSHGADGAKPGDSGQAGSATESGADPTETAEASGGSSHCTSYTAFLTPCTGPQSGSGG
jgi:hypothetical protein